MNYIYNNDDWNGKHE